MRYTYDLSHCRRRGSNSQMLRKVCSMSESMQLVVDELVIFKRDCVDGITANEERCRHEAEGSIALSTVIAATFGYPEGVRVAHYCEEHGVNVKEAVVAMGLLSKDDAEVLVDPMLMTNPAAMAKAVAEFRAKVAK